MHYDPILCMNVEDNIKTKDSMTFSIDVRGMDDRKVSRLIGEAQNLGFVTGDTGYTITLRGNGNIEKLKRLFPGLKLKTSNADSTKDSTLGSVEEYYNRMVGKNKSEVEKIVASAKGNPNADLAYKKWKAVNAKDEMLFYQLRFGSGKTEGAKLESDEIRGYAESLLNKYGEKSVTISRNGKVIATYLNRSKLFNDKDECPEGMTCDGMYEEVESKGPYMLTKSDSGRWAVLRNGMPIKYGMESDMRKLYNMILKNNGYTTDSKAIEFPSEKEAIEYCKENGINPHNIKPIGDKFVVNDKKSVLDNAIKTCDAGAKETFEKTKNLANQIIRMYSGTPLGRKINANLIIAKCEEIISSMDYYLSNINRGWYD